MDMQPTLADLFAWRRDNYGAFARGEISREEYLRVQADLLQQSAALRAKK
jgi:hypothetical protein